MFKDRRPLMELKELIDIYSDYRDRTYDLWGSL